MNKSRLILSLCLYLSSSCWLPSVSANEFIPLGDLPGGLFKSLAAGVSPDGSVVVGQGINSAGIQEAFRWTKSTGMLRLGILPTGGNRSIAYNSSSNGDVIVGYSGLPGAVPIRWTLTNGMESLGDLPGGNTGGVANDVAFDGSVIVGYSHSEAGPEAFKWDANNGMVGIGDLAGGEFLSHANAISADGSVIVGWGRNDIGDEAFIWTEGNGLVGLDSYPKNGITRAPFANDVSADGMVVVGQGIPDAFLWTELDGIVSLGTNTISASAINADGTVVVGIADFASGREAFIWTVDKGARNLREVLTNDHGLDLTGWTLTNASDISDNGAVIVGTGINPIGNQEAWYVRLGPAVSIEIEGGYLQECNEFGGSKLLLQADIDRDSVSSIIWKVDSNTVGYNQTINQFIATGEHLVEVDVVTDIGIGHAEVLVTITDTVAPQIVANIVDVKTGDQLSQILSNKKVSPSIIVTDACDPNPLVKAVAGIPTSSGDEFFVDKSRKYTSVRTDSDVDTFELSVTATDASGNTATEFLELDIITR